MKVDVYTRSVLTVIAVTLCAIAFQNFNPISEAHAQVSTFDMARVITYCWNTAMLQSIAAGGYMIYTAC